MADQRSQVEQEPQRVTVIHTGEGAIECKKKW